MTRIVLLHAYNAMNRGDGLLVDESFVVLREAFPDADVDLVCSRPDTFQSAGFGRIYDARPRWWGYHWSYLWLLLRLNRYDVIAGVGGGYLRFGSLVEAAKTVLVHGPQLVAAAAARRPSVYLPQSIGPAPRICRPLLRLLLSRISVVFARDDKTVAEVGTTTMRRCPDLALMIGEDRTVRADRPTAPVVVGTRELLPAGAALVRTVAGALGEVEGFVQSTVGSNDDRPAVAALHPVRTIETPELQQSAGRRVVISVRLHGALMALQAGHSVIHLSYERKGFGAFEDVGLAAFVHNVYDFDPREVVAQARALLAEPAEQVHFDALVAASAEQRAGARTEVVSVVRDLVAR